MTLAEAAAYLRVKPTTLYKWCDEGRLRYYELKTGRGRRFKRPDLDNLLEVREPAGQRRAAGGDQRPRPGIVRRSGLRR